MVIYVYDPDLNEILEKDIGDVANLAQMERELDELYECWADNPEDLEVYIDWTE